MTGHLRESCNHWKHPDFNHRGLWVKNEGYRKRKAFLESRGEGDRQVALKWNEYASGAYIKGVRFPEDWAKVDRSGESTRPPDEAGARRSTTSANTKADRGGRVYGVARKNAPDVDGHKQFSRRVEFEGVRDHDNRGGKHKQLAIMTHGACDCDDADIDITYRMCCISVNNGPPFKASTLFDTGAYASFVKREVAAWIGQHAGRATWLGARKRERDGDSNTSVSLAGTSLSSPILGSAVFDLTFLNEVTRQHDTIKDIHAQVIDSCIAVIIAGL